MPRCALIPQRLSIATGVTLLALVCATGPSPAAPPDGPTANRVWGGCKLDAYSYNDLVAEVGRNLGSAVDIDFIVVYSRENPNDGQELVEGEVSITTASSPFTGPILCIAPAGVSIQKTTETTLIPPVGKVDMLGAEEAFLIQYKLRPSGPIEKRFCHTAADNSDCFLIKP